MDSWSTACRTPNRTRIPATLRPSARWRTVASTPSAKPYSCIPLLLSLSRLSLRRAAGLAPLDELVDHRADQGRPAAARFGSHSVHGRGGHRLERGQALAQEPLGLRGRPDSLGRVQRMLHALTSLACTHQVTDGEADHYFHASHILSGVR